MSAFDIFTESLNRAESVRSIFDRVSQERPQKKGRFAVHETDLLRAAVVFLHASMEEYLRGILIQYYEKNPELFELEKSSLSEITEILKTEHSKTIQEFVSSKINDRFHQTSFNSLEYILGQLKQIGIILDKNSFDQKKLQEVIQRRHKIVHEMDGNSSSGRGHQKANPITSYQVRDWMENVKAFIGAVEKSANDGCGA